MIGPDAGVSKRPAEAHFVERRQSGAENAAVVTADAAARAQVENTETGGMDIFARKNLPPTEPHGAESGTWP